MNTNWYDYERHVVEHQEGIDAWISDYVGIGGWCEWWPIVPTPKKTRTFSFKDPKHTTMFLMKWS